VGPGKLKLLPSIDSRAPAQSAPPSDCLPAFAVQNQDLAPVFRPGDILVPVTCQQLPPVMGDYVLALDTDGSNCVLRYIALIGGAGSRQGVHLTWDGRRYRRLPVSSLRGRILSVRRGAQLFDLGLAPAGPWRRWLQRTGHRLLARLLAWLPISA
jgi:hypothetical protein